MTHRTKLGLMDRLTRVVRDHSCDVIILRVSSRSSRDALNKRSSTSASVSLEDLMDKEVMSSSQDGDIHDLSVLSDPANEKSTKIKQKICMLDHPKNLIEVLWA